MNIKPIKFEKLGEDMLRCEFPHTIYYIHCSSCSYHSSNDDLMHYRDSLDTIKEELSNYYYSDLDRIKEDFFDE